MIKLTFNNRYKSIFDGGDSVELPRFSVITGPNGSGKTQLLEAIRDRVVSTQFGDPATQANSELLFVSDLLQAKQNTSRNNYLLELHRRSEEQILTRNRNPNVYKNKASYTSLANINLPKEYGSEIVFNQLMTLVMGRAWDNNKIPLSVEDTHSVLPGDYIDRAFRKNSFSSSISDVFKNYQIEWEENDYCKYKSDRGDVRPFLSEAEFRTKFGAPPWEVFNRTLRRLKLNYEFNRPVDGKSHFHAHLISNKDQRQIVELDQLSSGEQTLLSIATGLYRSKSKRKFPHLLLLDEPDAHLHPSMSAILIEFLSKDILPLLDAGLILTTHSPSTCAFANREQLFRMDPNSRRPIQSEFRIAVSDLTAGLPINITQSVFKQVCVEDTFDANIYNEIWNLLRPKIDRKNIKPQLTFIPASKKKTSGGCTEAIELKKKLRDGGVETSFSLIDYDLSNSSNATEFVFGEGVGYSIESFILQPLLIAATLLHKWGPNHSKLPEYLSNVTFADFSNKRIDWLQKVVDGITQSLRDAISSKAIRLANVDINKNGVRNFKLMNGREISLPIWYLEAKGHELEELILFKFPELKKYGKNNKDIGLEIARVVASSHVSLIPNEFEVVFKKIINA